MPRVCSFGGALVSSLPSILRPRENPKIGLRVDPDISGVPGMRSFRVLTWTEYILFHGVVSAGAETPEMVR